MRERGRLLDQDGSELACGYESEAQFAPLAAGLAERAATEIHAWREGFPTMRSWAAYLDGDAEEGGLWREYDAAVTAALAGDSDRARHWFDRVFDHPVRPEMYPDLDQDDVVEAQRIAGGLTAALDDDGAFRAAVAERVAATRARLELPPVTSPDQALQAGGAIGSGPRTHATTGVSVSCRALTNARRSRRLRPRSASSRTTSASASPRWTRSTA